MPLRQRRRLLCGAGTRRASVKRTTADAAAGIIASNNMRLDNPIFNGGGFWGVMSLPEQALRGRAKLRRRRVERWWQHV